MWGWSTWILSLEFATFLSSDYIAIYTMKIMEIIIGFGIAAGNLTFGDHLRIGMIIGLGCSSMLIMKIKPEFLCLSPSIWCRVWYRWVPMFQELIVNFYHQLSTPTPILSPFLIPQYQVGCTLPQKLSELIWRLFFIFRCPSWKIRRLLMRLQQCTGREGWLALRWD